MNLSVLLHWVLTLQRIWLGLDILYEPINVTNAREFVSHMGDMAVELDYVDRNQYIPVTIERWRIWLPQHHQIVNADLDPREVYETMLSLGSPPPNWRGGTIRCGKRQIIFNPAWLSKSWLFYGSPAWMYIAAHERAHINQGCDYYDAVVSEWLASVQGLQMLAASDRPEAYLALIAGLREKAIAATVVYTNDDWILESIELSDNERKYFDGILAQCNMNYEFCVQRSEKYWIGVLSRLDMEIIK